MTTAYLIRWKRMFLLALVGSIAVCAGFGVLTILLGTFGEFEIKVLLTTLTVSATSLCGMSCGTALESGRWSRPVPVAGLLLAILGGAMVISGIWREIDAQQYWKVTATVAVFAVALSHVTLLHLARLSPQFRWAFPCADAAILGVAAIIVLLLWSEHGSLEMLRLLGTIAILDAALTLMIPVFHRLSLGEPQPSSGRARALADLDLEIQQLQTRLATLRTQREELLAQAPERSSPPTFAG